MRNMRPGFFTAEDKLHNIFFNSETVCCYEGSFMTCSIFSLNNAEAGSWRWDETQALDKDLGGPEADRLSVSSSVFYPLRGPALQNECMGRDHNNLASGKIK